MGMENWNRKCKLGIGIGKGKWKLETGIGTGNVNGKWGITLGMGSRTVEWERGTGMRNMKERNAELERGIRMEQEFVWGLKPRIESLNGV